MQEREKAIGEKEKQKLQQKRMKVHKASWVNCATVFVCKCKCEYVCMYMYVCVFAD